MVAGYPDADTSLEIALAAADAGADLLEVGLPYSDPLADGATLQRASQVAIKAGATLEGSLRLIERIGAARPDLPLVPMAYANQVLGGGDGEAVARRLAAAGAAGIIVADLTPDEGASFEAVARAAGLAVVYLVAPTTPPERRAEIAARSGGFLYCVSLVGVTGARTALPKTVGRLVRDVTAASPVPVGVGFGVSKPAHVRAIAKAGADGVIVASALVDALGEDGRDVAGLDPTDARVARRHMTIALLGVPTNSAGTTDGVARAPRALRDAGLVPRLRRAGPLVDLGDVGVDEPSPARGPDGIIDALNLAATLGRVRAQSLRRYGSDIGLSSSEATARSSSARWPVAPTCPGRRRGSCSLMATRTPGRPTPRRRARPPTWSLACCWAGRSTDSSLSLQLADPPTRSFARGDPRRPRSGGARRRRRGIARRHRGAR